MMSLPIFDIGVNFNTRDVIDVNIILCTYAFGREWRAVNPLDLNGRVALVTGATSGIGLATAKLLAHLGAHVVCASRSLADCNQVAADLRSAGAKASALYMDIERIQRAPLSTEIEALGGVDILVANAAINPKIGSMLSEVGAGSVDRAMSANVWSFLDLARLVSPAMQQRRRGAIVLVSSVAALFGNALIGVYGASKAAAGQVARNLAAELGVFNIRVNVVAPGLVRTPFSETLLQSPKIERQAINATALRRLAEPGDVAGVIAFLTSDAASFVTGQTILVDGGASAVQNYNV
jgi:dehydrogenase/reductase SDR family member 4